MNMSTPCANLVKTAKPGTSLTKAETVALWHATEWMALNLREWKTADWVPHSDQERKVFANETLMLKNAKQALRKVNKLRAQGL